MSKASQGTSIERIRNNPTVVLEFESQRVTGVRLGALIPFQMTFSDRGQAKIFHKVIINVAAK